MRFRNAHAIASLAVFILLVIAGSLRYPHFFSYEVFLNLLRDNAFFGIVAIGMTFVILSGGIDLSVGAMVGLSSILSAQLIEVHQSCHRGRPETRRRLRGDLLFRAQ